MVTVALDIPLDLVDAVISALYQSADWHRADRGHDSDGIAALIADSDRLVALAERLDSAAEAVKAVAP